MKKFFVLFLALTFVLSMSTFVFADDGGADSVRSMKAGGSVTIGGDARVRGIWQSNYNMQDTVASDEVDDRYWDQRVRLKINAAVGNGIEVRTRLQTDTDQWDGTSNTRSGALIVDYAYLHIPVNNFIIDAGLMKRKWGNKLLIWDQARDTFQVTTNVGDTQIGLYTDKVNETNATNSGGENLEDYNNYGIFVNHTAGNLAAGLHVIFEEDDDAAVDVSGREYSVYFNTSVGAITIASEFAYKTGDLNETAGKKPSAGFIYAATDVGAINVSIFGAIVKNLFVADNHLTPTVFLGTDNPTAIADVRAAANSTTKAIVIGASTDISSDLSVSAKLGWFDLEGLSSALRGSSTAPAKANDESATEIDLGLAYKLSDNAVYKIDFGYWMPDNITLADDNAMALAHKIEVVF